MAIASSTLVAWLMIGKPDFSMTVNGALAGLVAITAGCNFVNVASSAIIGLIAGCLVVPAVIFFDKRKLDDPVGALSVHLLNGVWGTLAVGLFASADAPGVGESGVEGLFFGGGFEALKTQFIGTVAVAAFSFIGMLAVWFAIKTVLGLRVSANDEMAGLDVTEMGMEAYPGDPIGR
jgi:Amt family ammonium transporter